MSDKETAANRPTSPEAESTAVEEDTAAPSSTEPVVATDDPAAVETGPPTADESAVAATPDESAAAATPDESAAAATPDESAAAATTDETAAAATTDETAAATAPAERVVYVTAPTPPRLASNRGVGSLIALASVIIYAALLILIALLLPMAFGGRFDLGILSEPSFYLPVLLFAIGFVLLVLIFNRAAWWAYIIGSILLAVFVYFGTIGFGLLSTGIIGNTPSEAAARYAEALRNPWNIIPALLAREVSMWVGAAISARGRRTKVRNYEAYQSYERELAETRAEQERSSTPVGSPA